ncbi:TPA: hypothetical protein O6E10_000980 [Vibrio cholerae]|jgi:hypothetical protein|nr:hypothetical protein [Vibrio cholerae]MBY7904799.1 hypothetical protein [Vibrio fluvialis]HDB1441501.1 hypothetical protein [Vibrio cholerae]
MKVRSILTVANNKNKTKQQTTRHEPHLTPSHTSSNNAIDPIQHPPKKTIRELFSQTRDNSIFFDRKQHESGSIAVEANTIATRQI